MKTRLLIFSILLITTTSFSQVVANQVDDFEISLGNWTVGNASVAANQISRPADGGPDGAGDAYFSYVTTGNANGAGSRMTILSRNAQWSGDFIETGIVAIKMNVRATTGNLTLRIGLSDEPTTSVGTQMVTTTPIVITAGSGWQTITIPIQPSDFTVLAGGSLTAAQVLANVSEMRILSNTTTNPLLFWLGETGLRTMDLDDITASTTLSLNDLSATNEFSISPNPATTRLNMYLPQNSNNANVSVFDVLGKRVYSKTMDALSSKTIDITNWNSGVYLVRISTDSTTQTKRFVKQ